MRALRDDVAGPISSNDRELLERERAETDLRMEAAGNLAGGVAHDFNNILMTIRMSSSLLLERLENPELRANVLVIDNAAERAVALTNRLLAFSREQIVR